MSNSQVLTISAGWVNEARRVDSPNFNQRPDETKIDTLIIHGISLPAGKFGGTYIDDLFTNQLDISQYKAFKPLEKLKVSAHFLIRRDGQLTQYVNVHDRAWHAGQSILEGVENCNDFSIGIELEGTDTMAYENRQYQQLVNLVHCLKKNYPAISEQRIVGHCDIAPGRKTDPGESFLWTDFFASLNLNSPLLKQEFNEIMKYTGYVRKMKTSLADEVNYTLPLETQQGNELIDINRLVGKSIKISYDGDIKCIACGRKSKKSFAQGYCYPCFSSLAECDSCIMSPEKCHLEKGTCRDEQWGLKNCLQDHFVYLARSSSVKVGITRATQIPTRWMDQGAIEALPIFRVSQRYYSGLLEVILKKYISDRTAWQKMLKGEVSEVDLFIERDKLFTRCKTEIDQLISEYQENDFQILTHEKIIKISYPVKTYPTKVKSFNLDKLGVAEGVLMGIKGQYLILDSGVINIRKYTGYQLTFEAKTNNDPNKMI